MKKESKSRRDFLAKFFTEQNPKTSLPNGEKIKMLTADGKLVEVSGPVVNTGEQKKKTSNAQILKWMNGAKKSN